MGGRGAASGISAAGKEYGTEYRTVLQSGNIKFIVMNDSTSASPLETMTKGRIYVTLSKTGDKLKAITFYDRENKRFRQIDLDHYHKIDGVARKPHIHMGYYHDGASSTLTGNDKKLIDKVEMAWYNKSAGVV